jgi:hypothetical protein
MPPRGAAEVEDQVDLFASVTIPFLVGNVLEPIEVGHRGVVEEHVDPTEGPNREIDQRPTIGGATQIARLQRHHRPAGRANCLHSRCRITGPQAGADDQRSFSSKRHGGCATDAAASARDDADLPYKPVRHWSPPCRRGVAAVHGPTSREVLE